MHSNFLWQCFIQASILQISSVPRPLCPQPYTPGWHPSHHSPCKQWVELPTLPFLTIYLGETSFKAWKILFLDHVHTKLFLPYVSMCALPVWTFGYQIPYLAGGHRASCPCQLAQWCRWFAGERHASLYRGHLAAGKGDKCQAWKNIWAAE